MKIAYSINGPMHTPLKHFAQQLGIKYGVTSPYFLKGPYKDYVGEWDYMVLRLLKQDLNDFGMEWNVLEGVDFIDGVKLGLASRDEEIEHFCTLLENMSRLGVKTVCYNWMPVWEWYRTRMNISIRGNATVTGFKMDDVKDVSGAAVSISKDQLWSNLEYFLKKVVPVAERCKVQLAIHPDDPPVDEIVGIQRILTSADAMWEVTQLVPSAYNGITLCQGTFSAMGEDVPESIRRFGKAGKLFFAHFRDVIGDKNDFQECFHFDGKSDMYECMKAYYDVDFQGVMRPDHVPTMYGDNNEMPSYGIKGNLVATGYMIGLMEAVEKERGIYHGRT